MLWLILYRPVVDMTSMLATDGYKISMAEAVGATGLTFSEGTVALMEQCRMAAFGKASK